MTSRSTASTRTEETTVYMQMDPASLKTIHRSIMSERFGRRDAWLRSPVDAEG